MEYRMLSKKTKFTTIKDAISSGQGDYYLRGWVYRLRDQKGDIFVTLRDQTGIIQLVVSDLEVSKEIFDESKKLTIESSFCVFGQLKEDKRAPGGFELKVKDLEIVSIADTYPI